MLLLECPQPGPLQMPTQTLIPSGHTSDGERYDVCQAFSATTHLATRQHHVRRITAFNPRTRTVHKATTQLRIAIWAYITEDSTEMRQARCYPISPNTTVVCCVHKRMQGQPAPAVVVQHTQGMNAEEMRFLFWLSCPSQSTAIQHKPNSQPCRWHFRALQGTHAQHPNQPEFSKCGLGGEGHGQPLTTHRRRHTHHNRKQAK